MVTQCLALGQHALPWTAKDSRQNLEHSTNPQTLHELGSRAHLSGFYRLCIVQTVIPDDAPEEERERIQREEYRYKARSLGNIKFISELFKRSLLSERIMHIVIKILLIDTDHSDPRYVLFWRSSNTLKHNISVFGGGD